jgi:hypothetical protein
VSDSTCGPDERPKPRGPQRDEQRIAPPRHVLLDIDPIKMTAACLACGENVAIRRAKRGSEARVLGINFVCAKQTPASERDPVDPAALSPTGHGRAIRSRFKMTEDEYDALWSAQKGLCAICRNPPAEDRLLAVDHDPRCCPASSRRTCGLCVRGLICTQCNWGLGYFYDDPYALMRAVTYVLNGRNSLMPPDVLMEPAVFAFKASA